MCRPSTALQAQEAASLQTSCLDTDLLEHAKLKNIHGWYSLPDSETDTFQDFLSGTTSAHSTVDHGEDELTFSAEVFLARILAALEVEPGQSMASDQFSGPSNSESLAKWDAHTCSWRTAQCSLTEGWSTLSGRWPRWGTARDGEFGAVVTWEHVTDVRGFGSLPTPRCQAVRPCNVRQEEYARNGEKGNLEEAVAVRYLVPMGRMPTPRSCSAMAARLDTNGQKSEKRHPNLETVVAREIGNDSSVWYLNPAFIEEMMGWPIGWAALSPLATDKIQEWRQQHSVFFHKGSYKPNTPDEKTVDPAKDTP